MRFSLFLPYPDTDPTAADPAGIVALAQAAEACGLDAVAASDHPFPVTVAGAAGHQALDPFVLLGHLAQATTTLRLHFNLVVTARALATVDHLSGGRVIGAVGTGYMRPEFEALGAAFAGRGARLEADVAAMRAAWSGEPVHLEGDGWRADGNTMLPRPPAGTVPLWRGGNGRRAIDSAVAAFDGWTPFEAAGATPGQTGTDELTLDTLPARLAVLREATERAGRTAPLDVCLVRPGAGWMKDRARAVDELQRLDALGVTWVCTHVLGRTTTERLAGIETLASIATAAS
jgi:alkanesulfonate monooxygenase SsuD/methylene tetrahydromethanopterin reductase-like flavin-dependent oxidoreductase (luciferase family)